MPFDASLKIGIPEAFLALGDLVGVGASLETVLLETVAGRVLTIFLVVVLTGSLSKAPAQRLLSGDTERLLT